MIDRKELRKKLPYGYCKVIAKELGVTKSTISLYFRGKTNSERVETAVLKKVAELNEAKQELMKQAGINDISTVSQNCATLQSV